jgi:hypothetical protein
MPTMRAIKKTPPITPPTIAPTGADLEDASLLGVVEGSSKGLVGVEADESVDSVDEGKEYELVSIVLDSLG